MKIRRRNRVGSKRFFSLSLCALRARRGCLRFKTASRAFFISSLFSLAVSLFEGKKLVVVEKKHDDEFRVLNTQKEAPT